MGGRRWLLMLAYHFPPENSIGGLRPYRFSRYLPDLGFTPHVITAVDVSGRPDLPAESVPDPFANNSVRGWEWQFERAFRKLIIPGAVGVRWSSLAYKAARRFIESHRNDEITIFSTWPPLGTQLAGWRLKRRYGLPWIADFRDPLSDNPVHNHLPGHSRRLLSWFESKIIQSADAFIANTDEAEAVLKRKYPRHAAKIHLLWNGFDPQDRLAAAPIPANRTPRIFSHVGELYEGRTAAPLVESMTRLFEKGRLAPGSVRLELTGPANESCLPSPTLLQQGQQQGWLKLLNDQVPKAEAVRLAETSDGLVLIQPQSAIQVPGKVYDYLQIGRPILALVPRNSSVERVLSRTGVPQRFVYTDLAEEEFDAAVLEYLQLPSEAVPAGAWFEKTFDVQRQTALLAQIIDDIQPLHGRSNASHR